MSTKSDIRDPSCQYQESINKAAIPPFGGSEKMICLNSWKSSNVHSKDSGQTCGQDSRREVCRTSDGEIFLNLDILWKFE